MCPIRSKEAFVLTGFRSDGPTPTNYDTSPLNERISICISCAIGIGLSIIIAISDVCTALFRATVGPTHQRVIEKETKTIYLQCSENTYVAYSQSVCSVLKVN